MKDFALYACAFVWLVAGPAAFFAFLNYGLDGAIELGIILSAVTVIAMGGMRYFGGSRDSGRG